MVRQVLLDIPGRLHSVDVHAVQSPAHPLHRVRVGDAVQIEHVHLGPGPAAHNVFPDFQLGGL